MAELTLVGFGPGPWSRLTLEARDVLMEADRIYVRDPFWEVCGRLVEAGKTVIGLHHLYLTGMDVGTLYHFFAEIVLGSCRLYGSAVYAVPGNPFVFEFTSSLLVRRARAEGIPVRVVEGMSCLETIFCRHQLDPGGGLQILNFFDFAVRGSVDAQLPALIFQIGAPLDGNFTADGNAYAANLKLLEERLGKHYSPDHAVALFKPAPGDDERQLRVDGTVGGLRRLEADMTMYSTLFVPAARGCR
ncbi:MAG: hypothetical protein HY319_07050 [Armatimonadetes bacterium]|nr:hypothetical protein [Armatimonadota bacterium]